ncbi:Alpha/Beta hydrolase protein [Mycena albidolilacea]|uniref:Alpha/Beta hydrolase protein n=1 Tax=Mycena albidolilacea TaxID=1033008 RepID=A0AAD7ANM4_9AGAR|nr:Alpha/Beta hydrolase protein [Mycena albidolilacea]
MNAIQNYSSWAFNPLVSFPPTVFPNTALWNVSNGDLGLEYQIGVSWPLNWTSTNTSASDVLSMYVLDGNALGQTASEAFHRRLPVEPSQPDTIVISIGYPLTSDVYSPQRSTDFRPPIANQTEAGTPGADAFLSFISTVLRPFVHARLFPNARFVREALYGHSFGGLFVIYALATRPDLFDTFLSASPALFWENGAMLALAPALLANATAHAHPGRKPAFMLSYGSLEQFPVRRRTETAEEFQARKAIIEPFKMTDNCKELYAELRGNHGLRFVGIKEYEGSDHPSVAAVAITDGADFFIDWFPL